MSNFEKYKKIIEIVALLGIKQLSVILAISYVFSLFASYHWTLDLFSHLNILHMIGGCVLGVLSLSLRSSFFSILCVVIAFLSFAESRLVLENPYGFFASNQHTQEEFVIVQYNQYLPKNNFEKLRSWIENEENLDVIVVQEATYATVNFAKTILKIYPYQIHEQREHPFGMVVLSKHPFQDYEIIPTHGSTYQNFALRINVKHTDFPKPISVYALHTMPPIGKANSKRRNQELRFIARRLRKEEATEKILIGDLNLTPFSPFFFELKKNSGLNYQSFGLLLNPTWPARHSFIPFLQIPIDHVLHSDSLEISEKKVGPSFGSDHHLLITTLRLKQ